jgi:tetratricopeptide (TPR) repeat protein
VLLIYIGGAWFAYQVVWTFTESLGLPTWFPRVGLALLIVLLPVVLATAFVQEGVGERVPRRTILLVAVIYVLSALLGFYVVVGLTRQFELPNWVPSLVAVLLIVLLPMVLWTAFVKEEAPAEAAEVEPSVTQAEASGLRRMLTWPNAFMSVVVLFALLGLGVTGYMGMRLLGIGPVGTLMAKGLLEEQDRIVLADFENLTPDSLTGRVVTEAFRTVLSQSQAVRLAERDYLGAVLKRMARDPDQPLTYDLAREVAIREGLKAVVAGQVGSLGQGYVLSVRLVAAETGEDLAAHVETAEDEDALVPAITRLSKWMRERIGESLTTVRSSPPLSRVRTASLEALRLFTEAEVEEVRGNYRRALYLAERAIEIDTFFAAGYRERAFARYQLGAERAQMIADLTRVYELRHRLPSRERLDNEAYYHWFVTGDYDKAINAFLSAGTSNDLGFLYLTRRDFARAEEVFRRVIERDSLFTWPWGNLVQAQFNQGKFDHLAESLRQFENKLPESSYLAQLRIHIASARGDYAASDARLRDYLASAPADRRVQRDVEDQRAMLALVQGRFGEAERHIRNAMLGNERGGRSRAVLDRAMWLGRAYLQVSGADRAVEVVDSVLEHHPLSNIEVLERPYMNLARFYVQTGRLERARRLLAEFEAAVEPSLRHASEYGHLEAAFRDGARNLTLGEVALTEGRVQDALAKFRAYDQAVDFCTICALNPLGRAYELAGQADSAIAVYERYVSTPWLYRIRQDSEWLAFTYERLGDLHEQRGDTTNAIRYYAKLIDLWKDADPELQPRVEAARRAIEALSPDR